jgi:hypothetical protein
VDFRVVLLDRTGVAKGELHQVGGAVWSHVLNGEGAADVIIDSSDTRAVVDLLTKAPLMLIYSDMGNWGGVIKRGITQRGPELTVSAWSNERLLRGRQTDKTRSLDGYTNGAIAQTLLRETNEDWPTLVTVGSIYAAGAAHFYEIHYDDLLERFQGMAATDGHDFEVTWNRELNWYERKGSDKPSVVLAEGRNVVRWPTYTYSEDSIVNDQHCIGAGTAWADKITSRASSTASQNEYGWWQAVANYGNVAKQDTLDLRAATLLANRKDPARAIDLSIVDHPSGIWQEFGIGDRVRVWLPSYHLKTGFDEMVRVLAREINAQTGIMRLVVEVS